MSRLFRNLFSSTANPLESKRLARNQLLRKSADMNPFSNYVGISLDLGSSKELDEGVRKK